MSSEFNKAVQDICEVLMFEHWLRFYFINENEKGALIIEIPEAGIERIREAHSDLLPLAESLNGNEISAETSRQAICTYIAAHVDGNRLKAGVTSTVFESSTFQVENQMFNVWVQSHEDQLDKNFIDFTTWRGLYAQWRNSDKVKAQLAALRDAANREAQGPSETIQ